MLHLSWSVVEFLLPFIVSVKKALVGSCCIWEVTASALLMYYCSYRWHFENSELLLAG